MLGSKDELIKKFQSEVDQADWEMLTPHFERQALFKVSDGLDLFEVAADLALDNVEEIQKILTSGLLKRASEEDKNKYGLDKNKFFANFLVIQPYVIFQEYKEN